jgi:hypothetical protein
MSDLNASEREELEMLRKERAMKEKGGLSLKVSEKGGVSLYGLGRFPVTLYKEQWLKLLEYVENISSFIKEHDSQLKTKDRN